jgi:hypothetical protein
MNQPPPSQLFRWALPPTYTTPVEGETATETGSARNRRGRIRGVHRLVHMTSPLAVMRETVPNAVRHGWEFAGPWPTA